MRRGASGLNLLLGIDKPQGMSSHDVVNSVRRALGERRVGHAGTLDPAATGVLVVGVGQGTRLMGLLTADEKSYIATITFGFETTTDDAEGEPTTYGKTTSRLRDESYAQRVLDSFLGKQMQIPPAYSAISVEGKRSYARARAGETVKMEPRPVEVRVAQLLRVDDADDALGWQCAFTVSKGTYVRALARDVGRAVGSAAHLTRLCRTASGKVTLAQCVSLDRICELGAPAIEKAALDPVSSLGLPMRGLGDKELRAVVSGRRIDAREASHGQRVALVRDGRLWGVWESDGTTLHAIANFLDGIAGVES